LIFTAYLDESGTHGNSPITVMGGFLGTAAQWEDFERRLNELRAGYGFTVFHATELKAKRGEFAGWSNEKCMSLVLDLTVLVSEVLTAGAFMSLNNARYRTEYRAAPKPKKVVLDTAYGLCFRACVVHFLQVMQEEIGPPGTGKLNIVLESGHRHAGDADRIFAEMQASVRVHFGVDTLGTLTTATKDCPFLFFDTMPCEASLIGAISLFKPRRIKHLIVAAITELVAYVPHEQPLNSGFERRVSLAGDRGFESFSLQR